MITRLLAIALGVIVLAACSSQRDAAEAEAALANQVAQTAASQPASAPEGVQWPNLRALDSLTHRVDALAARSNSDDLRELLPELHRLTMAVATDPAPDGADDVQKLAVLQKDLASLGAFIDSPGEMTDAEVIIQSKSFHPIVLEIMAAAGMPHVH